MAERLKAYKHAPGSFILRLLVSLSAVVTVLVLIYIIAYILIHGIPYLSPDFFPCNTRRIIVQLFLP